MWPPPNPQDDPRHLRLAFGIAASFTTLLWLIKLAEIALGADLGHYGIYPQRVSGLIGILCAPLIHGSLSHLAANTGPILVLGTALIYGYPKSAKIVLPVIYLGTGACVWLFARGSYHIGASGLAFGMMFFVFTIGALRWDRLAIALSMMVFFLYGGMVWGVLPTDSRISFESHFFGAALGIALAIVFKTRDPRPPEKKYSWEENSGEDTDAEQPGEDPWLRVFDWLARAATLLPDTRRVGRTGSADERHQWSYGA